VTPVALDGPSAVETLGLRRAQDAVATPWSAARRSTILRGDDCAVYEREELDMRFFRHKQEEQRFVPCPSCGELVPVDALECDMCGADLREPPPSRPRDAHRSETPH
jgi:hypothetical protein